jgi:hypothetical protein
MTRAPVLVFAYRRPDHLRRVLESLAGNLGAAKSHVFIYCDGARGPSDRPYVDATRVIARAATGFASVEIVESETNRGLSHAIVSGVSEICDRFGRAIILEDDVVPTPFFLQYCNDALDRYADEDRVLSIGCHTFVSSTDLPETFFLDVPDCWGWAVWNRSWKKFEPDGAALLAQISNRGLEDRFDFDGTYPYTQMLRDQVKNGNQSWAIRWYAYAFLQQKLVLYPHVAVTRNIGFDGSGTHGGVSSGYRNVLAAERPISVSQIDFRASEAGRESWKRAFRKMSAGEGLVSQLRHRLAHALHPHLKKILAK